MSRKHSESLPTIRLYRVTRDRRNGFGKRPYMPGRNPKLKRDKVLYGYMATVERG